MIKTEVQLPSEQAVETTFIHGKSIEADAAPVRPVRLPTEDEEPVTTRRDLRKFGLIVGAVLLALGAIGLWRGRAPGVYLTAAGAILFILGLVYPAALTFVYKVWMAFAMFMAKLNTFILLTLVYFLVITPMAFIMRLFGQDILKLKLDPQAKSYWEMRSGPRPPDEEHFTNQY